MVWRFKGHLIAIALVLSGFLVPIACGAPSNGDVPPNILIAVADDWGFPHAGAYGDGVVKTPTFDWLAKEGVLFQHAYASSPSCTPSRSAILSGQWHWRLGPAANLWSTFPDSVETYCDLLGDEGYVTGSSGKAWGPGRTNRYLAGKSYESFEEFFSSRTKGKPFCFWLGSSDPHRPYVEGSGKKSGMNLEAINLPACFPSTPAIRGDMADYYYEVQRFDALVAKALEVLSRNKQLENTMVVVTSDHGMPFPRCKSNLYDTGIRVPLVIRYPEQKQPGRIENSMVSLTDLAPTFLDLAGIEIPESMTGRSLVPLLEESSGVYDPRPYVLFGKERHVPSQEGKDMGGYPSRGIRTDQYLYIRNYQPNRWPSGTPFFRKAAIPGAWYADCDNGPTKTYMISCRNRDEQHQLAYRLSFEKRPAEELYDLKQDPGQIENVARWIDYQPVKKQLKKLMIRALRASKDPRSFGHGDQFDRFPYFGGAPQFPGLSSRSVDK